MLSQCFFIAHWKAGCLQNVCNCENGSPVTKADCTTHNEHKCAKCEDTTHGAELWVAKQLKKASWKLQGWNCRKKCYKLCTTLREHQELFCTKG